VNRRPFDRRPLPEGWLAAQVEDGATSDTRLDWLTEPASLSQVCRVIELADWVRYTRAEAEATRDSMAIPVLEAGPFLKAVRPWPRRK